MPINAKFKTNYTKKRYFVFGLIAIVALILPFITIGENHFFLLSFDKKELHLLFSVFSTQELFLMPFVLIMAFLGIFFITTLGGRIWCGWGCPQTSFRIFYRDFICTKLLKIRKNIKNKQLHPKGQFVKKTIAKIIFACFTLLMASNFMWYFIPPEDFFRYLANPSEHLLMVGIVLGVALFIFTDVVFIAENFCIYICPYARVQSVMFDENTLQVMYDEERGGKIYDEKHNKINDRPTGEDDECIGCLACVKVCPTHIDIRRGLQLECINCLECADACSNIMARQNKPSLVRWTSEHALKHGKTKILRFRTVAYMVALSIAFVALLIVGSKRETMLLNINRDSSFYNLKVENSQVVIENNYIFLIENTDKVAHEFYFETNNDKISVKKPKKPVKIDARKKDKIIVTLEANEGAFEKSNVDITIPLVINAYATDNKENINVKRDTIFVYPKNSVIENKLK
ncbi:cytochrome c oxidase accessory protein CcoG [Campylobacter ureolyticus]|uniref:Cytochrome c oxidase accessory protein n=1 Tax=Campylobacter ureolyticus TaxID=827 RepID=A0AAE7JQC1_9BACT|nr:cytochrome c oxidase accessory protein CcoG [Campylobacter ureolyticus]MCR8685380.1 cytochrome c oxidase accessory protein CcoG [Campylobacter ureolyticus]QKF85060.1 cytochrome c oxidase accessory protein [Campylobacter ureolyticus]QQY36448.1 cytochrome c oxidase accessory protein CcoG [Campylobacter ureolyticus]SUX19822.1 cytochrome c oxidase accessory protein CcoG [Campylobacter ureolyticus]